MVRVLEFTSGITSFAIDDALIKQPIIKAVEAIRSIALFNTFHQLHLNTVLCIKYCGINKNKPINASHVTV